MNWSDLLEDLEEKKAILFLGPELARLEGPDAGQYELTCSARLKGRKTLAKAKDGAWCGTAKTTGRTMEALSIILKKK